MQKKQIGIRTAWGHHYSDALKKCSKIKLLQLIQHIEKEILKIDFVYHIVYNNLRLLSFSLILKKSEHQSLKFSALYFSIVFNFYRTEI